MTAFEITFLGHQGWLFSAGESRLLVDPLLTSAIGHRGGVGEVYPPRIFTFEHFPRVSAVLLTHEHEDHFDIPSLARIDRDVPILLSAHSSRVASTFLTEMGFTVRRVAPGDHVVVGDLELHLFAPDMAEKDQSDEWDVLPFLVSDRRGHGSFFTTVDAGVSERLEASLRAVVSEPPVWCYTNNASDFSFCKGGRVLAREPVDTSALALDKLAHYTGLCFRWGAPPAVLFCGGGYAFTGERAWMNGHVFRADSAGICASLAALVPGRTFLAPTAGQTLSFRDRALEGVREDSPFLRAAPRAVWPAHHYVGEAPLLEDYAPLTAVRELGPDELEELGRELDLFAAHLCSRRLFRELLSLEEKDLEGRHPTFSLVALCDADGGSYIYEYDLAGCAFVRVRDIDPVADYVGGLECWASDLLALFRGEIAPSAISFGRNRSWNAMPERCDVGWGELSLYSHPLRRGERYANLYRRLLGAVGPVAASVPAAEGARAPRL